ncbi:hypothetical protein FNYG_08058 [Fusarium nygamai]|uniref:Uncharacterized protein n=1 Tax=Gibberella nygamai TaxID=42673 RepID=A0A2K0W8E7_GIBNY|nr:hypothetical protein FNYG_08058 [Fusarium nygamai]
MATAGPSGYGLVADQAESAQNSRSADSARQLPPHRTPLRSPSPCESFTRIPKPSSSHRRYSYSSLVHSSKSSSGPSRPASPNSSPASSVQEDSIIDEEVKEPEPDLPKAPEHFIKVFSVPKALFNIYETYREWHFGFAPMQNVQALEMELKQANLKREKAEQQVRDLTERLSSVAEPGPKIQPSEPERKCSEVEKVTPAKLRKERDARRRELIENSGNMPLEERFKELAGWSEKVEADIDAAQDRNTLLDDMLDKASRDIKKLKGEELSLKANRKVLEKQLELSRKQRISGHDSSTQTEGPKGEGVACQTTMARDDQKSITLRAEPVRPLAFRIVQENRLAELQRENDRLLQENEEMRNALEQPQSQDSPPEESESEINDATPEEAQIRSADAGVEVQSADVDMGGIATGQDSAAPENIEAPVVPTIPPATSEAGEILRFNLGRVLSSINRDPISSSDDARRRRDSRRHERRRRREQRRLEREEEARQRQQGRSEREEDARRPRKRHGQSRKTYRQRKKGLSPLAWVRYRQTWMDFLSLSYMFSSPLKLS